MVSSRPQTSFSTRVSKRNFPQRPETSRARCGKAGGTPARRGSFGVVSPKPASLVQNDAHQTLTKPTKASSAVENRDTSALSSHQELQRVADTISQLHKERQSAENAVQIGENTLTHLSNENPSHSTFQFDEDRLGNEPELSRPPSSASHSSLSSLAPSAVTTESRVSSLLDYLDKVDSETAADYDSVKNSRSAGTMPSSTGASARVTAGFTQFCERMKAKIRSLNSELAERGAVIESLRHQLGSIKEMNRAAEKNRIAEHKHALEAAGRQHALSLERHVEMSKKLSSQNTQLVNKIEQLSQKLVETQEQCKKQLEKCRADHARALRNQKRALQAAAKVGRGEWERRREAEIKEKTVKSLEPELERMMAQHKTQLRASDEAAQDALRRQRASLEAAHEQRIAEIRRETHEELERSIVKEAAAAATRARELQQRADDDAAEQRERMRNAFEIERETWHAERERERAAAADALSNLRQQFEADMQDLRRRHSEECVALRRQLEQETAAMEARCCMEQKKFEMTLRNRIEKETADERSKIREALLAERDEKLRTVVKQLEEEVQLERIALQKQYSRDREQLAATHESELRQLQQKLHFWSKKCEEESEAGKLTAKELAAARERVTRLESVIRDKTQATNELRERLERERENWRTISTQHREQAQTKLQQAEQQLRVLGQQKTDIQTRCEEAEMSAQQQVREQEQRHERQLDCIETRFKQSLARKDAVIERLRDELACLRSDITARDQLFCQRVEELDAK